MYIHRISYMSWNTIAIATLFKDGIMHDTKGLTHDTIEYTHDRKWFKHDTIGLSNNS